MPGTPESGKAREAVRTYGWAQAVRIYGWRQLVQDYGWAQLGRDYGFRATTVVLAIAVVILAIALANSGGSSSPAGPPLQRFGGGLAAVPTNRVNGNGTVTIQLRGNTATVRMETKDLLNGSPHLAHIHGLGSGGCPPASAARLHNGQRAISTGDGIKYYGGTMASFTEWGSTSGKVPNNIDMNRYAANGNIRYQRTMTLTRLTADLIRDGDAVVVVHGIDYNANHIYDFGALGVSDLDKKLPGEATAPALCGPLRLARTGSVASAPSSTATYAASLAPDTAPAGDAWASGGAFLCHLVSRRA